MNCFPPANLIHVIKNCLHIISSPDKFLLKQAVTHSTLVVTFNGAMRRDGTLDKNIAGSDLFSLHVTVSGFSS